ncbi:hypothetical protein DICPUDRAFT_150141 [Dictyostelium purpureum]|uniref:W2 domain-containing protein n=1 Tax=Dictyostelium purpureum TaxID=5786 RepID=F0ZFJ7_DICPU|nr:uncharacterized protein DICPUDRAFT_150141 [Dictyostelium purpureum]EGC37307.1 hypothetical protein DICPUDRAFT_150141 [Dictyostelium purpureum]|eukprot:XP_003286195.1 hypothetical protein DICPUDRAFT_150141 [Dictyostelium purpureum]
MAQLVNIRRNEPDPFYRYKMEVLQGKVEGKGNGIKTVIVNLTNIARDLERPPEYITKYYEIEFNTKSNIEGDKYSINGQHSNERLADVLDGFINKFVLCAFCKNPETRFVIKNKAIEFKCAACGKRGPADMKHKLSSYIVKNPPKASTSKGSTHDEALAQQPGLPPVSTTGSSSTVKKEKKSKKKKDEDEDDVVWLTDTSEKAAEERKKHFLGDATSVVANMMADVDISSNKGKEEQQEEEPQDPVSSITAFLASSPSDQELMEKLDSVQEEFELRSSATAKAAIEALGQNAEGTVKLIKNQQALIKKISKRRDGKLGILLGLEELCVKDDALLKSIMGILKNLYDTGVLSEENILKWYHNKAKSKTVIKTCSPFIDWLENAEEEEEDEEEDA